MKKNIRFNQNAIFLKKYGMIFVELVGAFEGFVKKLNLLGSEVKKVMMTQ